MLGGALEAEGLCSRGNPEFPPIAKLLSMLHAPGGSHAIEAARSEHIDGMLYGSRTRAKLEDPDAVALFDELWKAGYESFMQAQGPASEREAIRELALAYEIAGTPVDADILVLFSKQMGEHKSAMEEAASSSDVVHFSLARDKRGALLDFTKDPETAVPYWSDPAELAARAFEKLYADHSTDLPSASKPILSPLYPQGPEAAMAALALRRFFAECASELSANPNAPPLFRSQESKSARRHARRQR